MKRSQFGACALSLSLAAAWCAAASDWPQFLGPARNAVSPETGLLRKWPEGGPRARWSAAVQRGYGGAAVLGGKVYILDHKAGAQDIFRCFDLATGKAEWTCALETAGAFQRNAGSRGTPAVDDRYVFGVGPFGDFYAIEKATHKLAWRQHLLKDYGGEMPRWNVAHSPLLYRDLVVVAPQSAKAGVVACEKATGRARWQSQPIGAMGYASPLLANLDGTEQVVVHSGAGLIGVSARDGKILWKYDWSCHNPIPNPVPLGQGRFFLTNGYGSGCVAIQVVGLDDAFTVKELFKHNQCNAQIPIPVFYQDHLYAVSNNNEMRQGLMCLALDGSVKWRTGSAPNFDRGGTLLADSMIFQMDGASGTLHLLDPSPSGYRELAQAKVLAAPGKQAWAPLALAEGCLLVRDHQELKCLEVK